MVSLIVVCVKNVSDKIVRHPLA